MSPKLLIEVILALSIAALLALFASNAWLGGPRGALSWLILLSVLPWIACAAAVTTLILRRGKWSDLIFVHLLAMMPLVITYGILPMAYPGAPSDGAFSIRLPMAGPVVVLQGGESPSRNHHAMIPAQRWAYDIVVPPIAIDGTELSDHGCWGVPIVAPADGVVTAVSDGFPDTLIGQSLPPQVPPEGNAITLQLDGDTYLILAHLQQGSAVVDIGQSVQEGTPLARCGNSGSSDAPHLHIHRQLEDPAIGLREIATGLPIDFRDHSGPLRLMGVADFDPATLDSARVFQHQPPESQE